MKKCPYCAEEIQDDARVCKYCGKTVVDEGLGCLWIGLSLLVPIVGIVSGIVFYTQGQSKKGTTALLCGIASMFIGLMIMASL